MMCSCEWRNPVFQYLHLHRSCRKEKDTKVQQICGSFHTNRRRRGRILFANYMTHLPFACLKVLSSFFRRPLSHDSVTSSTGRHRRPLYELGEGSFVLPDPAREVDASCRIFSII